MDNGFGKSRNGDQVEGCIPHIVAGTNGRDYVANWNSRNSHPTYHIADDGTVTGIVHPDRRPTSTYPGTIDQRAVTVEIDNTRTGHPWPVSLAALAALAIIVRHHYNESPRAGKGIALNDPDRTQSQFFIGWHAQYRAVECPGPTLLAAFPGVIESALSGAAVTPGTPKPTPVPASNAGGASVVRRGAAGDMVRWVQERLRAHSIIVDGNRITVDGNYGAQTEAGVMALQQAKGLTRDGWLTWKAGETYQALAAAPAAPKPSSNAGFDVAALQRWLKAFAPLYARHLVVDGVYGPQTAAVVREYQERSGLVPDGVVGARQTLPRMRRDGFRG